jgi:deoxyhypusine monooxygenase
MTVDRPSSLPALSNALLNRSGNVPLAVRFRALFALKALASEGNNHAVEIIAEGSPLSCSES